MTDDNDDPVRLERLARAIRQLPRRQHEIFCASRFDNLSYGEIAERTGLSVEKVKDLLADALFRIMRSVDRAERRRWWQFW